MAVPTRQANLQQFIQRIQRQGVPDIIAVNVQNSVATGLRGAGTKIGGIARALGEELQRKGIPDTQRKAANTEIAAAAQQRIVAGWKSRLPANAPPYRRGPNPQKDRLAGLLGPTLASSDMLHGTTARTISFLNVAVLNRETRHWYRVNYGATGPKVVPERPKSYPLTIDGHSLLVLQDQSPPAMGSWLPRAFQAEIPTNFQPKLGPADVPGGGHRAALFTDLGVLTVATKFGPVYKSMFLTYAQRTFEARGRTTGANINVVAGSRTGATVIR